MREMKDSGIEWIGEIPKKWIRTALLNVLRCKICDGPHETPELVDEGIPFISVDSLSDSKFVNLDVTKKYISNELYNEYYKKAPLEKGDVLFSKAATIGKTAIVDNRKFMVWSPLAIIKVDENKCDNTFIYYLLNCESLIQYVSNLGGYNTQINVGMRALEKAQIPVPPCCEQRRIADYLDEKCAKIDAIIEKQQKIIEKLKEYKLSVITEAVTKGLNPDVEMKDSGIEWQVDVPAHWTVMKMKNLCSFHNGDRSQNYPSPDEFVDKGIPFIGADSLNGLSVDYSVAKCITEDKYKQMGGLKIEQNDILYTLRGSTIGKNSMAEFTDGTVASSLMGIRVKSKNHFLPRYILYYLNSKNEYIQRDVCINGSTAPNLSAEDVKNFIVFIPDIEEQNQIVDCLDEKCKQIEKAITDRESAVNLMLEYKKSMIYETVTGKKEV